MGHKCTSLFDKKYSLVFVKVVKIRIIYTGDVIFARRYSKLILKGGIFFRTSPKRASCVR
jgi:hypothetical protein